MVLEEAFIHTVIYHNHQRSKKRRLLRPRGPCRKMKPLLLLAALIITSSLFAPFARAHAVVATVDTGSHPFGVAYDSALGEVFVTSEGSSAVSVISDTTNTVIATVSVGADPQGVAYDSAKGEVFVANRGSNTVSVISDGTNTVVATVPVGFAPFGVAYDPAKGEVFVTNSISATVSVISDSTNAVVATVPVGSDT